MDRVCGFDVSPTHSGAVAIGADGSLIDFVFLSKTAKPAKAPGAADHGDHWPDLLPKAIPDQVTRDLRRLVPTMRLFLQWRRRLAAPSDFRTYGAIEAYAFGASAGAHTKGEIGGLLRLALMSGGWYLRTYDPTSVKIFATGDGDAEKGAVAEGVARKWGQSIVDRLGAFDGKATKDSPGEDLIDAYVLSQIALREIQLRGGLLQIRDLPVEERRVFSRITASMPVDLLGREWIHDPGA